MSFEKTLPTEIQEYEVYNVTSGDELEKVASSKVDFPDGFEYDPDYFYLWIRIISPGEIFGPNKNGDYFPEEELLESYETFNEAHVFKNHENKKIEKAIGRIFSVRWNPVMKSVEIFKGIDRKLAPEIVRGFKKGFLTDVSMGCKVPFTVCSVCGNKARKQTEFCNHIKNHRMQYLANGERVYEINYQPKFHDSSVVLNGAERVAKALVVFEEPEESTLAGSFRKAASASGASRFIRLTDQEMDKVAHYDEVHLHPLLKPFKQEKLASESPMMAKIAELEKEITGKLLNIVSGPSESKPKSAEQMVQIIKFLTEKRMDEDTLEAIGKTLSDMSKTEKISTSKAFSSFIGVAELMGIELFPTELHTILCSITSSKFEDSMKISDSDEEEVYPTDFARGMKKTLKATEQLPQLDDPSDLFHVYDEFPAQVESFENDPISFFESSKLDTDMDEEAPVQVVRYLRNMLSPFMESRSRHSEHLMPRLAVVLSGHQPLRGSGDIARDVHLMSNPSSLGDMMAGIAYSKYQTMRPSMMSTRLVKSARFFDNELEKIAASDEPKKSPKGIKRRTLLMTAVPAIYGASAFQKSRKENGKNMTDAENFIADRPDVLSAGVLVAGKPLSRGIMKGQEAARRAVGKGYTATAKKTNELADRVKDGFNKLTFEEHQELVKIADSLDSGEFMSMNEDMMAKFASAYKMDARSTAAVKIATLLQYSDMQKEASAILESLDIPLEATGAFMKEAQAYTGEEMHKAAGDFMNGMILDGIVDNRPISTTVHGRVLDAFVFKKLGDLAGGSQNPQKVKEEAMKGVVKNVPKPAHNETKGI